MPQLFFRFVCRLAISITTLLALLSANAAEVTLQESSTINYAATAPDVTFNEVLALSYRDSDRHVKYGDDVLQFGELWLPVGAESKALIIYIHGGCWLNEFDLRYSYALSSALAAAGYAVWSLEYRRTGDPGGGWPGTFADIQQAIAARSSIPEVTDLPLVLTGHSAGGHLALLAAQALLHTGDAPELTIGQAAITDVEAYARGSNSCEVATPDFMGGTPEQIPQAYQAATLVGKTLPDDTWLLLGDADAIVPLVHSQLDGAQSLIAADAGHFDWAHPGTPAFAQFLELLDSEL